MTAASTGVASLLPSPPTPRVYVGAGVLLLGVQVCCLLAWRAPNAGGVSPALAQLRLDPNCATAAELVLLPEIGPALAGKIVKYRASVTDGPAFRTADDLDRVPGIGPVKVARLRPYLEFGRESDSRPSAVQQTDQSAATRTDLRDVPRTDLSTVPRTGQPGATRTDPRDVPRTDQPAAEQADPPDAVPEPDEP